MTPDQLEEITARAASAYSYADFHQVAGQDVPALIGEIKRLTAELAHAEQVGASKFEYGQLYAGGGFLTFNDRPEILEISSIRQQIAHGQAHGGKVGRRRIIVLDDWRILRKGATR